MNRSDGAKRPTLSVCQRLDDISIPTRTAREASARSSRSDSDLSAVRVRSSKYAPLCGSGLPLHNFHDRVLAEPEIAGNQPVGQPLSMQAKHLLGFLV